MTLLDRIAPQAAARTLSTEQSRRTAIIDIGSNSIRLVVYDGPRRLPFTLFNEKIMAGLGAQLSGNGRIGEEAMERALVALERFERLCTEMAVDEVRCVANGRGARCDQRQGTDRARGEAGLDVQLLTGEEEGIASAYGLLGHARRRRHHG